ncbi:MAG: GNAT family N-acetyltransferase [Granulosicoccaceae bacterium]
MADRIERFDSSQSAQVVELFTQVFTHAEGASEGALIGKLVSDLIRTTPTDQLKGFVVQSQQTLVGSIFFTELTVEPKASAYILSPVAISTAEQGKGLGQKLINNGLLYLQERGVDFAFTYGDPSFYAKVGFQQIDEKQIAAPLSLSHPEGWLAQSLGRQTLESLSAVRQCVPALCDQKYW